MTKEIEYQKQSVEQSSRTCGAACLSMVYKALGKNVSQEEIWPAISKQNNFGSLASTTHLMTQDALNRGFRAVAVQARHPLQVLRQCRTFGIQAILNHRLQSDKAAGHYSVLTAVDGGSVELHDPQFGPSRRMSHFELLQLWTPLASSSEITGHMLLAVAPAVGGAPTPASCLLCRMQVPSAVECPACHKPVGLRPRAVLGCINDSCIARFWQQICCPACDHLWDFAPPAQLSKPQAEAADLQKVFSALDKFTAVILGVPGAANHPEIKKQLDFIAESKDKLKSAHAEEQAHRTLVLGQLADLSRTVAAKKAEQLKKIEELKTPLPPLDGHALGRALLKNLGMLS